MSLSLNSHLLEQPHDNVYLRRPLVGLVQHDDAVRLEKGVAHHLTDQDPLSHVFDASAFTVEALVESEKDFNIIRLRLIEMLDHLIGAVVM